MNLKIKSNTNAEEGKFFKDLKDINEVFQAHPLLTNLEGRVPEKVTVRVEGRVSSVWGFFPTRLKNLFRGVVIFYENRCAQITIYTVEGCCKTTRQGIEVNENLRDSPLGVNVEALASGKESTNLFINEEKVSGIWQANVHLNLFFNWMFGNLPEADKDERAGRDKSLLRYLSS